jgi:hypothetical protein
MLSRVLVSRRRLRSLLVSLCAMTGLLLLSSGALANAAITHPYTGTSFGPGGVGSGSFGDVVGLAVDQTSGDVFVLDSGEGGRVYKLDSAEEPVDFSSSSTNIIEGVGAAGGSEAEIAVDESSGPDAGDIYVANNSAVRIYAASGTFLGELSGGEMCGVAIDPSGNVYVGIYGETVKRYTPAGNPVTNADETGTMRGLHGTCNIAVDAFGDVYAANYSGGVTKYNAMQFGSLSASGESVDSQGRTLTVDTASGDVLIDEESKFAQYDGATEPPELEGRSGASGVGALGNSFGIAINNESGDVYVGDGKTVEIFGPNVPLPDLSKITVSSITSSSATLHADVEPEGTEVASCTFEYGTEAGALTRSAPCTPGVPYSGSTSVAVAATLSGLAKATAYHYRVAASNLNGTNTTEEATFRTAGAIISKEGYSEVGSNSARLGAEINPGGEPTSYRIEYGPTSAYGSSTTPVDLSAASMPVGVVVRMNELTPGTFYHLRFAATNGAGTVTGNDLTFTTHPLSPPGLPDDRGYEMVTPAEDQGAEPYAPDGAGIEEGEDAIQTSFPVIAAADGEAVTYAGSPTSGGNGSEGEGLGNQFLARRNPGGGWTQSNIQPPGYNATNYWAFSNDLEAGVLVSREQLTPEAPDDHYRDLYVRNNIDGSLQALSSVTPPNRTPEEFGAPEAEENVVESSLGEEYAGASADFSHQLFEANDALASPAVNPGRTVDNLYDSVDGELHSVNVLPDGSPAPDASFGGPTGSGINGFEIHNAFSHVISADGSRIFWTDMTTDTLYVRENDATTKPVAEEATYLTASTDGSKVLYTKAGDLYEDDLATGVTTNLAPGGEVQGLVGASEDLEYIYFAAHGILATGASEGRSNLYVLHNGGTRLIAILGAAGQEMFEYYGHESYAWTTDQGYRPAQVTSSGLGLVFMSRESLTGYDNVSEIGGGEKELEVFDYDASNGQLSCVSCNPTGEPPTRGTTADSQLGGLIPISRHSTYQPRAISEDGDQVFFESHQELLPQAGNDKLNVYEWERDGAGSCGDASGCIYLLSSGSSSSPSYFVAASANGNDVFFMTRSQLVRSDENEYFDVYDARVGAVEAAASPECTGTGCQGAAAAAPIFATPASATFVGVGNFAPAPTPVTKPKPKSKPKKKPKCAVKRKQGKPTAKKSVAENPAKQAKAKPVRCKAKKAAKNARPSTKGRGGR